jgi:hypothetical protein
MKKIIKLTESDINNLVKKIINESYDPNKLYSFTYIKDIMRTAPGYMKKYLKDLPKIPCTNSQGEERICTQIPEVIHAYITRKF